jgi:secondary thiamine-phosphate synthase enzyme
MIKKTIDLKTARKQEFIDITGQLRRFLEENRITEGVVTVYVPHTTAGVVINESADPDVVNDIGDWLDKVVPENQTYRHFEGNSPAHIKSIITGSSVQIGVENGKLILGTWQGVFFCEFDGPRSRKVFLFR